MPESPPPALPGGTRREGAPVDRRVAELFVAGAGVLTECPVWDDRTQRLLWTDIYAGTLNSCDAQGGDRRQQKVGLPLGSFAPRESHGFVLALETGLALSGDDASTWTAVGEHRALPTKVRFNDGACDPAGRFLAGTMGHLEEPHAGALYRLDPPDPAGHLAAPVVAIDGTTVSNGIGWSLDGRRVYYVDSAERRLDVLAYDLGAGVLADRRPLVRFGPDDGYPDGLAVDAEGCVWLAFWDGGRVARYTPDGELVGVVDVPVARVSSCAFGGPDLTDLFITTASYQLTKAEREAEPLCGSIFRCRPGATGLPIRRYAG